MQAGEPLFLSALERHLGSLDAQVSPAQRAYVALSSGHDTNLLLFLLAGMHDAIRAFTVGGRLVNEIDSTRKILASYPGCRGASRTVPASIAKSLPDIAWRLEGYVFERGVFLQYALAELLREAGGRCVVLGEGADQIVDPSGTRIVPRLAQRFRDVRRRLGRSRAGEAFRRRTQSGPRRVVPAAQRDIGRRRSPGKSESPQRAVSPGGPTTRSSTSSSRRAAF